MATYNRRETTIKCIQEIEEMKNSEIEIEIAICDDFSTDGTFETIREMYPSVHIFQSQGNLFWAKSMNMADIFASEFNYDYLVWLNDDTHLYNSAFEQILSDYRNIANNESILVGALKDPITGKRTYSGCLYSKIDNRIELEFVSPFGMPVQIGMFSGNFVCIPRKSREALGPISKKFSHGWADMEYGFRAFNKNIECFLMSEYVGESSLNPLYSFHTDPANSLSSRMRHALGRKAYHPIDYLRFCVQSFGFRGIPFYAKNMSKIIKQTFKS